MPSSAPATFVTHSVDETREFGAHLGHLLVPGIVVALSGDLGAGKTSLTQGIAIGLGIDARVTSPTFTLVNEYDAGRSSRLIHMDSYRLGDSDDDAVTEAETVGIEEVLDDEDAVVVIEWAERLAGVLPSDCLKITLAHDANDVDARRIKIIGTGPRSLNILQQLQ
jgi:tRNA threonylcarbamoyladenosine biosynthesis protein TsaE